MIMMCTRLDKIEAAIERTEEGVREIQGTTNRTWDGMHGVVGMVEQVKGSVEKLRQNMSTFSRTLFGLLRGEGGDAGDSK